MYATASDSVSRCSLSVTIRGLRFDLGNRAAAEQDALRAAVQDAMGRAQAMAAGAGRRLGAILKIEEQQTVDLPAPVIAARTRAALEDVLQMDPGLGRGGRGGAAPQSQGPETPVEPNQIEIRTQVVLTGAIL